MRKQGDDVVVQSDELLEESIRATLESMKVLYPHPLTYPAPHHHILSCFTIPYPTLSCDILSSTAVPLATTSCHITSRPVLL